MIAAVLGLHLVLIGLLLTTRPGTATRDALRAEPVRVTLRVLPPTAPLPAIAPTATPPAAAVVRRPPAAPTVRARRSIPAAPSAETITAPLPAIVGAVESAASAPPPPSLIDSDATRRAIRASARDTGSLAQQAALAGSTQRPSGQERLGTAVKSAARGDCDKGEFTGGGLGLLSIPFLAAAMARGDCAR